MGICDATSRKCIQEGTIASQRYLWIRVNSARQVGRAKIVPFALEMPKNSTFRALLLTSLSKEKVQVGPVIRHSY
jgi:hypothetical protein